MEPEQRQRQRAQRALVVEDNADTARSWAMLLGLHGYEITVVPDGPSALQAVEKDPPDVVLLDIGLPGMNGFEVAQRLRQQKTCKRPVIIAITGHGQYEDRLHAYEVGIDLHLVKPVPVEELTAFLRRYQTVAQ